MSLISLRRLARVVLFIYDVTYRLIYAIVIGIAGAFAYREKSIIDPAVRVSGVPR